MPVEQRITSVHDAYSTNEVCSPDCGGDLTRFIGRQGVVISKDSYGYLGVRSSRSQLLMNWGPSPGSAGVLSIKRLDFTGNT
jgi:hypothetical protein